MSNEERVIPIVCKWCKKEFNQERKFDSIPHPQEKIQVYCSNECAKRGIDKREAIFKIKIGDLK